MAFGCKRDYKEFNLPEVKPSAVTVLSMSFVAVRGNGDPNEEDDEHKRALYDDSSDVIPAMQSGITRSRGSRTPTIDATFCLRAIQQQFDERTIHSGNL